MQTKNRRKHNLLRSWARIPNCEFRLRIHFLSSVPSCSQWLRTARSMAPVAERISIYCSYAAVYVSDGDAWQQQAHVEYVILYQ